MTTQTYGAADLRADWCTQGDEVCDIASTCTGCDKVICPEHSDEFTTCAGNVDLLHCLDCEKGCIDCAGPQHMHPRNSGITRALNVARRNGTPYQPRHCSCPGCSHGFPHIPVISR